MFNPSSFVGVPPLKVTEIQDFGKLADRLCVTLVPLPASTTDVFLTLMSVPSEPPVFRIVST